MSGGFSTHISIMKTWLSIFSGIFNVSLAYILSAYVPMYVHI